MARRLAPAGLVVAAVLLSLAGAASVSHLLVLAAVPAAAVAVLDTVTERVARRSGAVEVALAVAGLGFVVAAGAARWPLLGLPAIVLFSADPWAESLFGRRSPDPLPEV
jgi:hypothetical protein